MILEEVSEKFSSVSIVFKQKRVLLRCEIQTSIKYLILYMLIIIFGRSVYCNIVFQEIELMFFGQTSNTCELKN